METDLFDLPSMDQGWRYKLVVIAWAIGFGALYCVALVVAGVVMLVSRQSD